MSVRKNSLCCGNLMEFYCFMDIFYRLVAFWSFSILIKWLSYMILACLSGVSTVRKLRNTCGCVWLALEDLGLVSERVASVWSHCATCCPPVVSEAAFCGISQVIASPKMQTLWQMPVDCRRERAMVAGDSDDCRRERAYESITRVHSVCRSYSRCHIRQFVSSYYVSSAAWSCHYFGFDCEARESLSHPNPTLITYLYNCFRLIK